jgi:hypothetical protein
MNEQIKNLAIKSGLLFQRENLSYEEKKFAELIIQECARIARATQFPDTDAEVKKTFGHTWDMAAIEAGREIVNHFEVK